MARLRCEPEDFRVDEIPLYAPAGEGGHTFVRIQKRLRTTEEVARDLARAAGARPADVGYAGRKDRVAVTTQWFSVRLAPEAALALPGASVISARHPHKLRTGQLAGNRFGSSRAKSTRRACATPRRAARPGCAKACRTASARSAGWDGGNLEQAQRLLRGERTGPTAATRFLISAGLPPSTRCWRASASAIRAPTGRRPRAAPGGRFVVQDLAREAPRAAAFEISATDPSSARVIEPTGAVPCASARPRGARVGLAALKPPPGSVRGARRALRVR
jgi:tRNA pseudouridine13 synthase